MKWDVISTAAAVFICAICPAPATAAGDEAMPRGRWSVGFEVLERVDSSRTYGPPPAPNEAAPPRPLQITLWYPAANASSGEPVSLRDYLDVEAAALGPGPAARLQKEIDEGFRRAVSRYLDEYDVGLERVLNQQMMARRGADPAPRRFPLLIHLGFGVSGQSSLIESLASHGYVIAGIPLLSTHPAWFHRGEQTAHWIDAFAEDIGFTIASLENHPAVDASRIGAFGMVTAAAAAYRMQHGRIDAVAVLDGSYPPYLKDVPGYDPRRFDIPVLELQSAGARSRSSIAPELAYAKRLVVESELQHIDFYQFRHVVAAAAGSADPGYAWIARMAQTFFASELEHESQAAEVIGRLVSERGAVMQRKAPVWTPPSEKDVLLALRELRFEELEALFRTAEEHGQLEGLVDEAALITTARFLARDHGPEAGARAFRLIVAKHPGSWRAVSTLASMLGRIGRKEEAIETYESARPLLEADRQLTEEERIDRLGRLAAAIEQLREP